MGLSCPVKNGDSLSESVTLPILEEYPKVSSNYIRIINLFH